MCVSTHERINKPLLLPLPLLLASFPVDGFSIFEGFKNKVGQAFYRSVDGKHTPIRDRVLISGCECGRENCHSMGLDRFGRVVPFQVEVSVLRQIDLQFN